MAIFFSRDSCCGIDQALTGLMLWSGQSVLVVSLAGVAQSTAVAQIPGTPGQDDPGRIEQQLPIPDLPKSNTDLPTPQVSDDELSPTESGETFELKDILIEGATVYSVDELRSIFSDRLNQSADLGDLYDIAQIITEKYQKDGYILSLAIVPEQVVQDGVARIQVIEGFVEDVEFENVSPRLLPKLKEFGSKIQKMRPLNADKMERTLLLGNDLSGIDLKTILKPGESLGTAILLIRAPYDPIDPFVELSNRGSEEVGPLRLQAGTHLNSLLGQGERLTLRAITTPEDPTELALGSLNLSLPIGADGLRLEAGGSYTEVNPNGTLKPFDINGRTIAVTTGLSYPIIRSRRLNFYAKGSFDYADTRNISNLTDPETVISQDRIAALRGGISFDHIDSSGFWTGDLELSQGIAGTTPKGATPAEPISRSQGSAIFTKLNLNIARLQQLPEQFNLLFQATTQLTGDALLIREQFGLGGSTFGSAFNPSELLGDYGFGLRLELQRPFLFKALAKDQSSLPYLFVDHGRVYRNARLVSEKASDSLTSTGLGFRHRFGQNIDAALEMAFPVDRTHEPNDRDPRFFFSITGTF